MRQEIRFCPVEGGRVAYATVGEGPPLVLGGWWVSHLEIDWERPEFRAFVETLAAGRTVIRYDTLGTGLSDRVDTHGGLEEEVASLEAVVDATGAERAAFFGVSCGACVAASFAARHPERAESLVLYGGYPDGSRVTTPAVRDAMLSTVRSHWGLGSRLLADVFFPEASAEELDAFARFQRAAAPAETAVEHLGFVYAVDVREELPRIEAPTLVLHRRDDRAVPHGLGRELAAAIPGAGFATLEGRDHLPWRGDAEAVARAVREFLGDSPRPLRPPLGDAVDLSDRELGVLRLVAEGLTDAEIAERLVVSPHTVHRHVANIRTKLRQPSRTAAVAQAARLGLI